MRRPASPPPASEERDERPDGAGGSEDTDDNAANEALAALSSQSPTPDSRRMLTLLMDLGRFRSLRDPLASICEDLNLTPTQVHALVWLGHDGPMHVGVLAQRIGITKKTITGVVDRLAEMGTVERTRDTEDRRAVVASLTASGTQLSERIARTMDAGVRQLLSLMEAEDRDALFGMLERILARLRAHQAE
ncbi:MarR family transcriptional regulator [Myxococcaceae bacterium JPH2]|nr:MarR family transcriptional regulator [Myxococcaceae bacterium JPH2]